MAASTRAKLPLDLAGAFALVRAQRDVDVGVELGADGWATVVGDYGPSDIARLWYARAEVLRLLAWARVKLAEHERGCEARERCQICGMTDKWWTR